MAVDIEKQRARWRRNKRDERMNKLSTGKHLSPEFLSAVIAERDRRITETPRVGYLWRRGVYFKDGSWEKAIAFLADVWAADYCLKAELGESNAKPKRVIEWLCIYGLDHGYTQSSLRKLIYQLERVSNCLKNSALGTNTETFGGHLSNIAAPEGVKISVTALS